MGFNVFNIFLCILFMDLALAITSGSTQNGDIYICLEDDQICPTIPYIGQNTIDPRISDFCATGFYPCFGIKTECGEILVGPVSEIDGISDEGSHPWQAFLSNATHKFAGSGALLDPFHVITAAHKVDANKGTPEELLVYMGVWDPSKLDDIYFTTTKEILTHPLYNKDTLLNDIAILRLDSPIVLGTQKTINTICLPKFGSNFVGKSCMVAGWGQSSFNRLDAPTNPPKQVSLTIKDYATCRESFARSNLLGNYVDTFLDPTGEICAGGEPQMDACTQDGGSPLTCKDSTGKKQVAGLVIWGKNCGQPGVYGVYVNVAYYSNWIATTIDSLNAKYA